jgi:cystathionine gamma-synthase
MVRYPFLPSHPQYRLARRQMGAGSGIFIAELNSSAAEAVEFCRRLKFFTLAESLGGVESLICHPPTMTHASVPPEVRRRVGIGDGLLRFSVGIEDLADLRHDIDQALNEVLGAGGAAKGRSPRRTVRSARNRQVRLLPGDKR